jgi:predicted acetyltransferase
VYDIKLLDFKDEKRLEEFNTIVHGKNSVKALKNVIFRDPFNGPQKFAYIEEDNKIISMVGLRIHKQQFGEKSATVGELSAVGTLPEYRKKGLATILINYWLNYMKENRIPLCFLFGIANFYQQFAFEYAVPIHFYNYLNIDREKLKNKKSEYTVEKLDLSNIDTDNDIKEIMKIYDRYLKKNFCAEVRSYDYWKYRIKTTSFSYHHWYVIKSKKEFKGYLWVTEGNMNIVIREGQVIDEEGAIAVGQFLYESEIENIGMKTPLNNSLANYLYKWGAQVNCTNEIYPGAWAGMYKIISLKWVLELIKDSLEERLIESKFYNATGNIKLYCETEKLIIEYSNSKIIIKDSEANEGSFIPINILTAIITGYKSIEYYKTDINYIDPKYYELLKVLFPKGNPYIYDLEMSEELE